MKTFPFPSMLVGMTRFELATSGPPDRCATGLRHIPPRCNWLARRNSQCEFGLPPLLLLTRTQKHPKNQDFSGTRLKSSLVLPFCFIM